MSNVCIIPARGGSTRIPLKNIRDFHGKPIISYSIEKAKESGLFDQIIVSTDSEDIASVAKDYGADAMMRSDALSVNEVGTYEVVRDAIKGMGFENVCCIYATSPLMDVMDLIEGSVMLEEGNTSHVISVGYPPLQDAAQFYWSRRDALISHVPYWNVDTRPILIDPKRVCDINTERDWKVAEAMHAALAQEKLWAMP